MEREATEQIDPDTGEVKRGYINEFDEFIPINKNDVEEWYHKKTAQGDPNFNEDEERDPDDPDIE